MAVTFRIEHFEGPLDLLLQLVEQEKLDISQVSLAKVADQFVTYVNEHPKIELEEMADFLLVAAKLVYLKSKLLLPSLYDQEMEEGPDLEAQLRLYREFIRASREIDKMWKSKRRSFTRSRRPMKRTEVEFAPPSGVTVETLCELMRRVIVRLMPLVALPTAAIERVVTVQEKIKQLFSRIRDVARTTFRDFLGRGKTKPEAVASFLALLELVKQRFVRVSQTALFHDIDIEAHPDAPATDPLVESYV